MLKNSIIIFILIIIIFICILNNNYFKENYEMKKNRGMLILYGESFREGTQGSRSRDTETSVEPQKQASDSHISFCNYLKNTHNIDMDIIINTPDTKYESELKTWYNGYNLTYMKNNGEIGFNAAAQEAVNNMDKEKYDFIFLTRMDVFIKPYFYNIFNPNWKKIYFISQDFTGWGNCGFVENTDINIPAVNPIFEFIPNNYFKVLSNINIDHLAWNHYNNVFNLTHNDMDFMCNEYYDADSYKDFNPYYKMISREENTIHYDNGKTINKNLFGTKEKIHCNSIRLGP